MEWTNIIPTRLGYYWARQDTVDPYFIIVFVNERWVSRCGTGDDWYLADMKSEGNWYWYGPLPEPQWKDGHNWTYDPEHDSRIAKYGGPAWETGGADEPTAAT